MALRSWAFVASRCAPVRSFAGRPDHKQFKAWPGLPRESVSGNGCRNEEPPEALLWRLERAVQPAGLVGFQWILSLRLVNVFAMATSECRQIGAGSLASMRTTIMRVWQLGQRGRSIGASKGSEKDT